MMEDMRTHRRLLVIPARGGSKRIPRKNIVPFCGDPLILHVLRTARACSLFSHIHVSTDDAEIAAVAAAEGFSPGFLRPAALADDHATLVDILRFVVARLSGSGSAFTSVTVLMPTAPLVLPEDLVAGHAMFDDAGGTRPVLAVARLPVPVEWAFRRAPDGTLTALQPGLDGVRSQDLQQAWYDAGAFAIYPASHLTKVLGAPAWLGHPLPRARAVDIDTEEDLHFAALLFRAQRQTA